MMIGGIAGHAPAHHYCRHLALDRMDVVGRPHVGHADNSW